MSFERAPEGGVGSLAIEARGVSKRYALGTLTSHRTLRHSVESRLRRWLGIAPLAESEPDHIWSLRDVDFDIAPGEVVGVIGRNGAGKSTLLRILSGITLPTKGRVRIAGQVGALLEVGTGFHPELTGRENIYLTGAILGIDRRELDRRFDEIVAFSGLERFLETPIKHYSSGMQLRLAFSVAAHLRPEILIIDEVLAVGDAEFQARCLDKLREHVAEGRTVLFTSHDLGAVQSFCSRALWLDRGRLMADGPAEQVIARYLRSTRAGADSDAVSGGLEADIDEGLGEVTLVSVRNSEGQPERRFRLGERWWVQVDFTMHERMDHVVAGLTLALPPHGPVLTLRSHACDLDPGRYCVSFEVTPDVRPGDVRIVPLLSRHEVPFYRATALDAVQIDSTAVPDSPLRIEEGDLLAMPPRATIWGAVDPPPSDEVSR